jgi:hypothetical protein
MLEAKKEITVREASAESGLSPARIIKLANTKQVEAHLVDAPVKYWLINRESLQAYLSSERKSGWQKGRPRSKNAG